MSPRRAPAQPAQKRNGALAQIHIAKVQLGMCDGTYRDMLWAVARVRSAKDLDHAGREKVLAHLKASGFKPAPKKTVGRVPHNLNSATRGPLLQKIEALLTESGRPWTYASRMARHMFKVGSIEFAHEGQLHAIVAALEIDKGRRAKAAAEQPQP